MFRGVDHALISTHPEEIVPQKTCFINPKRLACATLMLHLFLKMSGPFIVDAERLCRQWFPHELDSSLPTETCLESILSSSSLSLSQPLHPASYHIWCPNLKWIFSKSLHWGLSPTASSCGWQHGMATSKNSWVGYHWNWVDLLKEEWIRMQAHRRSLVKRRKDGSCSQGRNLEQTILSQLPQILPAPWSRMPSLYLETITPCCLSKQLKWTNTPHPALGYMPRAALSLDSWGLMFDWASWWNHGVLHYYLSPMWTHFYSKVKGQKLFILI